MELSPDTRRILEYLYERGVRHHPPSAANVARATAIPLATVRATLTTLEHDRLVYRGRHFTGQFHLTNEGGHAIDRSI